MKINQYTKQDLESLPDTNSFWEQIDISGIRDKLKYLLDNPVLENNDLVLFTGEENDRVVSYMSVCPEIILPNGHASKIYWLNTWWVDPAFQDTGIAGFIFFKAWNTLDKKIGVASFSDSSKQFYDKIGKFDILRDKNRYSMFVNIDTNLILLKYSSLKPFAFLLNLMRIPLTVSYYFLTLTLNALLKKNKVEIKNADNFDDQLWDFVKGKTIDDLVLKSKEYFRWKLNKHISFKVLHEGTIIGFISAAKIIRNNKSLSNQILRVEYFLIDNKYEKMIAFVIISLAYKLKCNRIVTESEELAKLLHKYRFLWLFKITQKKNAIISKAFDIDKISVERKRFHMGDGG